MKLNERFEIDENELDSLQDKSAAPEALSIFYGALLKLSMVDEIDAVRDVFEKADEKLRALYENSSFFARDFYRVDGQLLRCFNQKVVELKGYAKLQPEDGVMSTWERGEYESMNDKELRVRAKKVYCEGKKKLDAMRGPKDILTEKNSIAVELSDFYKNSDSQDDLGKWIFMLDKYLKRIADRAKGSRK